MIDHFTSARSLRLKQALLLTLLLLLTSEASPCLAQDAATVKVDDKDYTVTPLMRGRMFQLTTPDGQTAMITTSAGGYRIVSPPNGIYNGIDYKPLIAKVWQAYQDQKNGTPPTQPPPSGAGDPNAARRAEVDALAARAISRTSDLQTHTEAKPAFKTFTESGAVVTHPKFGDITVTDNGMKYEWTINPVDPRTGQKGVPSLYTVSFEGGENEAGAAAKTGKLLKGVGTGVAQALNHNANAASSITTRTDVWREVEQRGKVRQLVFESGGIRVGGTIGYNGRDTVGSLAEADLNVIRTVWSVVAEEINKAKATNQNVPFDLTSDRFKRAMASLDSATAKFNSR